MEYSDALLSSTSSRSSPAPVEASVTDVDSASETPSETTTIVRSSAPSSVVAPSEENRNFQDNDDDTSTIQDLDASSLVPETSETGTRTPPDTETPSSEDDTTPIHVLETEYVPRPQRISQLSHLHKSVSFETPQAGAVISESLLKSLPHGSYESTANVQENRSPSPTSPRSETTETGTVASSMEAEPYDVSSEGVRELEPISRQGSDMGTREIKHVHWSNEGSFSDEKETATPEDGSEVSFHQRETDFAERVRDVSHYDEEESVSTRM